MPRRADPQLGLQSGDIGGDVVQRHHVAVGVAEAAAGRDALEDAALRGRPLEAEGGHRDAGQHQRAQTEPGHLLSGEGSQVEVSL